MALIKSIPTEFGVNAEYWMIGVVQEDFYKKSIEVTLYGYANRQARTSGKQPLSSGKVKVEDGDYFPDASREALYEVIKRTLDFQESTDD